MTDKTLTKLERLRYEHRQEITRIRHDKIWDDPKLTASERLIKKIKNGDGHDFERAWLEAKSLWFDEGDIKPVSKLIREGYTIPYEHSKWVADAIERKPRNLSPNHKNQSYLEAYQFAVFHCYSTKTDFKRSKQEIKAGLSKIEDHPRELRIHITTRGYGVNEATSDYLNRVMSDDQKKLLRHMVYK